MVTHSHRNQILDALPVEERERLSPHLVPVEMRLGRVLYQSEVPTRHIYFPADSLVSLLHVLHDGASAEIAVVGNEGAVGLALFMGGGSLHIAPSFKAPVSRIGCPREH